MKNMLSVLLCLALLVSFAGCDNEGMVPSDGNQTLSQNLTYDGISYYVTPQYNEKDPDWLIALTIRVVNQEQSEGIQTIPVSISGQFTENVAYFVDVTFDGIADLLIPLEQYSAYAHRCLAYAFDPEIVQFREIEGFSEVFNPAIDYENQQILSHVSGNRSVSYTMYEYNRKGVPQKTRTLYWTEAEEGWVNLVEQKKDTVVKNIKLATDDPYTINKTDSKLAKYYEQDSLWDLDSEKWVALLKEDAKTAPGSDTYQN